MRSLIITSTLVLLTACRSYPAVAPNSLNPQTTVRVFLNDAGRQSVLTQIGPNVDFIEGTVVIRDSSGLRIDAGIVKRFTTPAEKYSAPRSIVLQNNGIATATVPRISKSRSWLLGGAIALGALLVGDGISGGDIIGVIGRGSESPPR